MTNEIITRETNTITEEQASQIFTTLIGEAPESTEKLKEAEEITQSTKYSEIEEIDDNQFIPGVVEETVQETKEDTKEVLETYGISDEETSSMIELIEKYKNHADIDYYTPLPESFKAIADGFKEFGGPDGKKIGKNHAAMLLLDELIHDSQFNNAMDNFQKEISDVVYDMNVEYNKLFTDAFNETFAKIDELKVTDPEQAEKIIAVKQAFEDATNFDRQKEYLQGLSSKKLAKLLSHYDTQVSFFNKYINVTEVKVPDVGELLPIIKKNLPEYSENDIKLFILAICKSCYALDFEHNVANMAYIYKLISSIYMYKFTECTNVEDFLLFGKIADVIDSLQHK